MASGATSNPRTRVPEGLDGPDLLDVAGKLMRRLVRGLTPIQFAHDEATLVVACVQVDTTHAGRQLMVNDTGARLDKQGDKVQLTGFGTFEVRERKARTGVKPGTSEKVEIPASKAPAFKAGKGLKDQIGGGH